MRNIALAAIIGCLIAAPAAARNDVSLESSVYIERSSHTDDGRIMRRIEPASRLVKGDKVVLVVEWRTDANGKPPSTKLRTGFAVTSPIPGTLKFQRSGQDGEQVSVDGGASWGELGEIKIREGRTMRLASAADVTHVRWQVSSREASRGNGRITYSAVVR